MTTSHDRDTTRRTYGLRFRVGVAGGWGLIAFGVHSAFRTFRGSNPYHSVVPLVLFALANDLLLAPLAIAVGLGLRRVLGRGPLSAAAVGATLVSVLVVAFTWPEIRHYGKDPTLASSLQPLDYATGVLTVVAVVWATAAVVGGLRLLRGRSLRRSDRRSA